MVPDAPRLLRADAARNAEKIIRAGREVFAEQGPDAHLDEVARRAGPGAATLFRRFPDKAALLRAVLDQRFGEHVRPVIRAAAHDPDPTPSGRTSPRAPCWSPPSSPSNAATGTVRSACPPERGRQGGSVRTAPEPPEGSACLAGSCGAGCGRRWTISLPSCPYEP
ncbi:helix-turn-helix domain-containing protein [Streptomyces sp. CBMA123]|uniref:TetR/AcrR family transcriptional regulator n=1 Tax=Streptomyces sp. CBMA123 TaxID=1896313 RepID=UPI0016621074